MSPWKLVGREIAHRPGTFLLGLASTGVAAGVLVASAALLRGFDLRTEELVGTKEKEAAGQMAAMEEEYRTIGTRMGFNVLILPKDLVLGDFYAEGYGRAFMPEAYARTLADSRDVVTIRHLLPMLQQKVDWPERKRTILLVGVRGEMPWAHRDDRKPLVRPVPPGTATIGHELARSLGIAAGDEIVFHGRRLKVNETHPERGTVDDITVWIDLAEAQEILDRRGQINVMMALECNCAMAEIAKVREEIGKILPDTQVVEIAGKALARAEARRAAGRNAALVVERERSARQELRRGREDLIALVVPLVIAGAAIGVGVLALANARERRLEVGILRALGLGRRRILFLFVARAALVGLAGAALGVPGGLAGGIALADVPPGASLAAAVGPGWLAAVVALAPAVTVASSWLPALGAAQQDPADVLREG